MDTYPFPYVSITYCITSAPPVSLFFFLLQQSFFSTHITHYCLAVAIKIAISTLLSDKEVDTKAPPSPYTVFVNESFTSSERLRPECADMLSKLLLFIVFG